MPPFYLPSQFRFRSPIAGAVAALFLIGSANAQQQDAVPAPAPVAPPVTTTAAARAATTPSTTQPAAKAAPAPAADAPLQKVEVRSSLKAYDDRRDDTATKVVVSQEEMLRHGDTTLAEALKRMPGITIGGIQGRGGDIRMRGMGNGYTQILLNGDPTPPGFSIESLSPDLIERVEIMRAATADLSTQAIAGTINVILKKTSKTAQQELKLGFTADGGRPSQNTNFIMSDHSGALSYSLTAGFWYGRSDYASSEIDDSFDLGGAQTRANFVTVDRALTYKGINLAPRLNWTVAEGELLTLQGFFGANPVSGYTEEHTRAAIAAAAPRFAGTANPFSNTAYNGRADLIWAKKLPEGAKADVKIGGTYFTFDSKADLLLSDANRALLVARYNHNMVTDKGASSTAKYSTPVAENHALAVGWDGSYSHRLEHRIQLETAIKAGEALRPYDQQFTSDIKRLAAFVQDEWNVTPRWSVYLGLRWEAILTDSVSDGVDAASNRSAVWSPIMQTLWKLPDTKDDQLRFAVTRTYKAPQTGNLLARRFYSLNNSVDWPDSQGNPSLKPELAWGFDLGYEHFLPEGGILSASSFVRRIKDRIRNDISLIDTQWVAMPINDGTAVVRGLELEAKLPLHALFPQMPAIDLRLNLARNWSNVSNVPGPDNRLGSQTPASGNVGFDYKIDGQLTVGGNFNFQAGGPVQVSKEQRQNSVAKRALDTYALWKYSAMTQLRFTLANMLHQDNVVLSDYRDGSGLAHELNRTPTNVVARLNVEMKF